MATVQIISKAYENISQLQKLENLFPADVRVEAVGLLNAISEPSFRFIALLMSKILTLFEPPNSKRKRRRTETNKRLQDFIVEQSLGVRIDQDNTAKRQRLCIMDVLT